MPDKPELRLLTLSSIAMRNGRLVVEFTDEVGDSIESTATVHERDGIRVASIEPDYFMQWDGTAESVRTVVRAIVAFADTQSA